jgi:hypothetical protein
MPVIGLHHLGTPSCCQLPKYQLLVLPIRLPDGCKSSVAPVAKQFESYVADGLVKRGACVILWRR